MQPFVCPNPRMLRICSPARLSAQTPTFYVSVRQPVCLHNPPHFTPYKRTQYTRTNDVCTNLHVYTCTSARTQAIIQMCTRARACVRSFIRSSVRPFVRSSVRPFVRSSVRPFIRSSERTNPFTFNSNPFKFT